MQLKSLDAKIVIRKLFNMKVLFALLILKTVSSHASNYGYYDQLCLKENNGFLRHPHDCYKFIRCSHQRAYEFQCPSNLLWHHEIKTCDFSYRTQCKLIDQFDKDLSNIELEREGDIAVNLKGIYEDNYAKYTQTQYDFAKQTSKLKRKVKRNANVKRKCQTRVRENVKTTVNKKHTVKAVAQSIYTLSTVKLTEPYNRDKVTTTEIPEKNGIIIENLYSKNSLKSTDQTITNHELIETTTKNLPDVSTVNTPAKISVTTNNYSFHKQFSSSIYSLNNSSKNHFTIIKRKEKNSSDIEVKLIQKQNSTFHITADKNLINLTATMLNDYFSKTSTFNNMNQEQQTTSVNLTESKNYTVTLSGITESFLSTLSLTDNSAVKATDEENESKVLTTKDSGNVMKTEKDSVNSTETVFTNDISEISSPSSSNLKNETDTVHSVNLTELNGITESFLSTLSLTEALSVKTTDEENENTILTTKYPGNFLQSPTKTVNINITTDYLTHILSITDSANQTETMLTSYLTQNATKIFNSTIPEENKTSVKLPVTLKEITMESVSTSSLTDSSTVKTTGLENEYISSTAEFIDNSLNSTKSSALIYNSNITGLETTANNSYVNLTETTLEAHSTETSMLNYNSIAEETNFVNLQEMEAFTGTLNIFTQNSLTTSTVKSTDKKNENVSFNTKDPVYLFTSAESSTDTNNNLILKETMQQTAADDEIVNLTEATLTEYAKENYNLNFYSLTKANKVATANLEELTVIPAASSEITKGTTASVSLTDSFTANLTDKESENRILATKDIIKYLENSTDTDIINVSTDFAFSAATADNSVNLTYAMLTSYLEPVKSTSIVLDNTKINKTGLPEASNEITEGITASLSLTDYSTVNLTEKESENRILTTKDPIKYFDNSTDTNNINNSTDFALSTATVDNSVNLTETILTSYLELVKSTSTIADNITGNKNENITEKSDILLDITSVKANYVTVTENSAVETTEQELKSTQDGKEHMHRKEQFATITYKPEQSSVTTPTSLADDVTKAVIEPVTEAVTEFVTEPITKAVTGPVSEAVTEDVTEAVIEAITESVTEAVTNNAKQNVNNIKPANFTESSENHNDLETFYSANVLHLTTENYKKNQIEFTTTAISITSQEYLAYDTITQDPRLPFRSIECQGDNNRRQLKAAKCYQYYQCFAGWAFLLNCHEGWRFQGDEEQCVLDVNRECDSE